jgi:hypothetical protein
MSEEQSQAEKRWLEDPLSGIIPFSAKDDLVRPGKTRSPRESMEAAQRAVALGETGGVYWTPRPESPEGEDQNAH